MIRAIIFDCFGVLTTDHWREFLHTQPEEIRQQLHELNRQLDSTVIGEEVFYSQASELTGLTEQVIRDAMAPVNSKNAALVAYIRTLKNDNFAIGMISNVGDDWIQREFLEPAEVALFDAMILSYQVHMTKPQPEIYHLAADRLGVKVQQCVFIDDVQSNCEAAEAVGMCAITYSNFAEMRLELNKILSRSE